MSPSSQICVMVFVVLLNLSMLHRSQAAYIDCSMECLFAAFRQPTVCECNNNLKLHWGKRAPRTRSHSLPTFRYGKRSVRYNNLDGERYGIYLCY